MCKLPLINIASSEDPWWGLDEKISGLDNVRLHFHDMSSTLASATRTSAFQPLPFLSLLMLAAQNCCFRRRFRHLQTPTSQNRVNLLTIIRVRTILLPWKPGVFQFSMRFNVSALVGGTTRRRHQWHFEARGAAKKICPYVDLSASCTADECLLGRHHRSVNAADVNLSISKNEINAVFRGNSMLALAARRLDPNRQCRGVHADRHEMPVRENELERKSEIDALVAKLCYVRHALAIGGHGVKRRSWTPASLPPCHSPSLAIHQQSAGGDGL